MERKSVVYNPVEHRLSESIVSATIGSKATQDVLAEFKLDADRYNVRAARRNFNFVDCTLSLTDLKVMDKYPSIVITELRHFQKRQRFNA